MKQSIFDDFVKELKEKNKDKYKYIDLTLLDNGDIYIYGYNDDIINRDILVKKTYWFNDISLKDNLLIMYEIYEELQSVKIPFKKEQQQ